MTYFTDPVPQYHLLRDAAAFDALKQRIYSVTGCDSYRTLAVYLETSPAFISDARRRLRWPARWVLLLYLKTGINPQWLLEGEGEKFAG